MRAAQAARHHAWALHASVALLLRASVAPMPPSVPYISVTLQPHLAPWQASAGGLHSALHPSPPVRVISRGVSAAALQPECAGPWRSNQTQHAPCTASTKRRWGKVAHFLFTKHQRRCGQAAVRGAWACAHVQCSCHMHTRTYARRRARALSHERPRPVYTALALVRTRGVCSAATCTRTTCRAACCRWPDGHAGHYPMCPREGVQLYTTRYASSRCTRGCCIVVKARHGWGGEGNGGRVREGSTQARQHVLCES